MKRDENLLRVVVLAVSSLSTFLIPFVVSSVNIALPSIGKEFSLNAVLLSWVITSYIIAAAIFLVPFGRIADIYGRKKFFAVGVLLFSLTSLLCSLSRSISMLLLSRVLQGISAAMIFGTGTAILTSVYPLSERGKALGINVAATYLGLSVGPFLGGLLTHYFGWRSIFLAIAPFGLVAFALVLWKVKGEWAEAEGERFDLLGSLIYAAAILAVMYGFSELPALSGFWLIFAGIVGLALFVRWELRTMHPVLDVRLFRRNVAFAFSNLAALINYSATYAVGFVLSLYLQYIKGFSADHAGVIMVAQPVMQFIFSPLTGWLSDRIEPRLLASAGMALTAAGLLMLVALSFDTSVGYIVVCLLLLGLGFALFSSPNTNAVMSSVEKKFYGVASGTLSTMRLAGQMLSMGILTLILVLFLGRVQIVPRYFPAFIRSAKTAFAVFAILCFIGIFASLARGNLRTSES
ncbi:MAG: MFS transporter [Thermacetogeniaceae bacterium]